MTRIALISSEPLRASMAGIGIRYAEFARRLSRAGLEVVVSSPAAPEEAPDLGLPADRVRPFERGRLASLFADCDAAVAQGQLANDVLTELPDLPVAIDLYDPWLIENLSYYRTLGLGPFRNDHATWLLQLRHGDFFLCSSEEQKLFYLGFLTALGRVHPERLEQDPDLAQWIAPVPFGVPDELPIHRPYLPPRQAGERRILFGGLYDWYDPWTLLEALDELELPADTSWTLLLIRNPNPDSTPQRLFAEVEAWCRRKGWWEGRVQALDWVPAERRYDLLRDVDLLVAPHRPSLETRLSLRTRFLDALASGCPVIATEGGAIARMIRDEGAGWVVPPGDSAALAVALSEALLDADQSRSAGARRLAEQFRWDKALEPLLAFCRDPRKNRFAGEAEVELGTPAMVEPWKARLRRQVGRRFRHLRGKN